MLDLHPRAYIGRKGYKCSSPSITIHCIGRNIEQHANRRTGGCWPWIPQAQAQQQVASATAPMKLEGGMTSDLFFLGVVWEARYKLSSIPRGTYLINAN